MTLFQVGKSSFSQIFSLIKVAWISRFEGTLRTIIAANEHPLVEVFASTVLFANHGAKMA